jgi:hypothetical protein
MRIDMAFMDRIEACATYNVDDYVDFCVGLERLGGVARKALGPLKSFPDTLIFKDNKISLNPFFKTYQSRTDAMGVVIEVLRADGLVPGWRDEAYPVGVNFTKPALFQIERAAISIFGIKGYGVHMNGFVRDGKKLKLWIAKRSINKQTGPGKLDQIVAGGQPVGMKLKENLIKECAEEANIPYKLVAQAVPVGTVSYTTSRSEGLRDDTLFNYDLELPADFQPENTDGEVEAFYLWSIDKVCNVLKRTDDFKFNSGLVVIDFLVRHGFIDSDEYSYSDIVSGLHR